MMTNLLERAAPVTPTARPRSAPAARAPHVSLAIHLPNGAVLTPTVAAGRTLADVLARLDVALRLDAHDRKLCQSCHLRIADAWLDRLPPVAREERDMLGKLDDVAANSRLACQIELTPALDGLEFAIDESCLEPQTYWVAG